MYLLLLLLFTSHTNIGAQKIDNMTLYEKISHKREF